MNQGPLIYLVRTDDSKLAQE